MEAKYLTSLQKLEALEEKNKEDIEKVVKLHDVLVGVDDLLLSLEKLFLETQVLTILLEKTMHACEARGSMANLEVQLGGIRETIKAIWDCNEETSEVNPQAQLEIHDFAGNTCTVVVRGRDEKDRIVA